MKISQFKKLISNCIDLQFQKPDGTLVPAHFHVTEAGLVTKHFIDCGGVIRTERCINFQLWVAGDVEHRLAPSKLLGVIQKAEGLWGGEDLDVEMEYQSDTISRYGVEFDGDCFRLACKQTNCLALDSCGIPETKRKLVMAELPVNNASCCKPGDSCC